MFPPVGNIPPRETTRDVEVDGIFIPQGTLVSGGIYQVHHDPELWENADGFDPDRWGSGKKQPANAWYTLQEPQHVVGLICHAGCPLEEVSAFVSA